VYPTAPLLRGRILTILEEHGMEDIDTLLSVDYDQNNDVKIPLGGLKIFLAAIQKLRLAKKQNPVLMMSE
jgi:hypothetical protein